MFNKDQFMEIQELDTVLICQMEDAQFNKYSDEIHNFTEKFPEQETSVKDALKSKDQKTLRNAVTTIHGMMNKIHAANLAKKCSTFLEKAEEAAHDELQALAIEIIKAVATLSIDLQMLEYKSKPSDGEAEVFDSPTEAAVVEKASAAPVAATPPKTTFTTKVVKDDSKGKNNVVAVDDTSFFLATIKSFLADSGYNITCINGGKQTLNYLKNNIPDLFILDIEMPEMDGFELAEHIRGAGITVPIIFLTGNSKTDAVQRAIKVGANDFIIKPVNKAQLLERIGRYIEPDFDNYYFD
ncbi:MAG: response regulator [Oscillospiraceae bacterium]|jgi:CheY-like chemotaxis protein/HPt (histidine-containing phosphotransfer) domain-containing protein|nr:response regulator [Oscillospiraceae bacterium]